MGEAMSKAPNILWICTDQQRFDTIGALGYPGVSTPNIDRLVAEGVAFTHAYCQSPICTPSRASFLTGQYPSRVHITRNGNDFFPPEARLVTRMLADEGYDCGLIGKLHLASAYRRIEARTDDGYRYWQYSHAPRDDWAEGHDYADWVRAQGYSLKELTRSIEGVPAPLHQTTWCAEKTMDFIRSHHLSNEGPWLASVNLYDPHPPFNPPQIYRDQFDPAEMPPPHFQSSDLAQQERLAAIDFQSRGRDPMELDLKAPIVPGSSEDGVPPGSDIGGRDARRLKAAYYAMIKLIDDQVGRILELLDETGQRENTVIIFMSDHGETLGDHGLIEKGCRFYEGLVRVPLIISWPGHIVQGVRADALVELMDVTPTIMELAGLSVPENVQGKSLLPILTGRADPAHHREFVRCEYYDALAEPDASFATMYRDARYKLVVYHGHGLGELYDLAQDPHEFHDLWDDPALLATKLDLMQRSFDASMLALDVGSPRIGPM